MFDLRQLERAHEIVGQAVPPTPAHAWPLLAERPGTAGLISATRGNHGQSLAFAASRYRLPVTIYVPYGNSVEQNRAIRGFGAELVEHGEDFQAAREEAYRRAETNGLEIVPAFHP